MCRKESNSWDINILDEQNRDDQSWTLLRQISINHLKTPISRDVNLNRVASIESPTAWVNPLGCNTFNTFALSLRSGIQLPNQNLPLKPRPPAYEQEWP
jgi:hypothetical protein